jgi:hypothetical protein
MSRPLRVAVLTLDQRASRAGADAVPAFLDLLSPASLPTPPLLAFQRTVGDEVQGVTDDADTLVEVVGRALRAREWNIGIGFGDIETPLPPETRAGRGPAYLHAREAVTRAKSAPHRVVVVGGPRDDRAAHLETVLGLWAGLLARRTDGGWEVHDLLAEGLSYSAAGERLGITQSAVSQRAQAAGLVDEQRARALATYLAGELLAGRDTETDDEGER